ncbi:hypothetical protein LWM68_38475 [Niabella sp. W65]|nr:hypothetical protein [Niabella sp. W65]MCH7368107.1 hypothetical protein [Niabella sp. W65]
MKKVIVTGNAHPILMQTLTEKGFDVAYKPQISYEEIKADGQGLAAWC